MKGSQRNTGDRYANSSSNQANRDANDEVSLF